MDTGNGSVVGRVRSACGLEMGDEDVSDDGQGGDVDGVVSMGDADLGDTGTRPLGLSVGSLFVESYSGENTEGVIDTVGTSVGV